MRLSNYFLPSLKETPADAELASHRYMLRAGMIRKLASGLYTWLPLGLRVLRKVEAIIREEMQSVGALEILMPAVQPAELWQETGRWEKYGKELLRFNDRHDREFCFGPTHEEVITKLVSNEVRSYKQLPLIMFQIQTKFRDEIRPRFGLMRAREFMMKDAYSFHTDSDSLQETYDAMFASYKRIFSRLGLDFRAVLADSGSIGGAKSHEFHVLSESGEDLLAYSDSSEYAANLEKAEALLLDDDVNPGPVRVMVNKIKGHECEFLFLCRSDDLLNTVKLENILGSEILSIVDAAIEDSKPGAVIYADKFLQNDTMLAYELEDETREFNLQDLDNVEFVDVRNVRDGDASPDGCGKLRIVRGIEVGHVFQLGDCYTSKMNSQVLGSNGKNSTLQSGCYGIGVSRVVAAAIEQNHDDRGIIWSDTMAPFRIMILPLLWHKSFRVKELAEKLYQDLTDAGFEVLLDDRKERAGVMFSTADLIGIPHVLVISEKCIEAGQVEYARRSDASKEFLPLDNVVELMVKELA